MSMFDSSRRKNGHLLESAGGRPPCSAARHPGFDRGAQTVTARSISRIATKNEHTAEWREDSSISRCLLRDAGGADVESRQISVMTVEPQK